MGIGRPAVPLLDHFEKDFHPLFRGERGIELVIRRLGIFE
jgi:hypothetical protein